MITASLASFFWRIFAALFGLAVVTEGLKAIGLLPGGAAAAVNKK